MYKFLKNTFIVGFSQIVLLLSGLATGILLPKIMTIDSYGNYKLYTLYLSYVGLFHFGFIDGVYLKYGGVNYEELDRNKFRGFSKYLFLIETIFALGGIIASLFLHEETYRFVFVFLSVAILTSNVLSYYQYISQITKRFKEYSYRNIIRAISSILIVIIAYFGIKYSVFDVFTFKHYILLLTLVNFFLVVWYTFTYRELVFGKSENKNLLGNDIRQMHVLGLPLMVSNLIISLIFALDRQFVSLLFSREVFAVYSFAYNLLSIATTMVTAISVVLYPMLKGMREDIIVSNYNESISILNIVIFCALIVFFPFCYFIRWFLPGYESSITVFRIIIPGIALSSTINIIIYNYYKCIDWTKKYFKISIFIFTLSFLMNTCAYVLFHNEAWISVASIITLAVWYIMADGYIRKRYSLDTKNNTIYIFALIIAFYIASNFDNYIIGMIGYFIVYVVLTIIFYKNIILTYIIKFKATVRSKKLNYDK